MPPATGHSGVLDLKLQLRQPDRVCLTKSAAIRATKAALVLGLCALNTLSELSVAVRDRQLQNGEVLIR